MEILKKLYICIVAPLFLSGCYSDFEPDIESTPVLCMTSIASVGDTLTVDLTRTWRWSEGKPGQDFDITVSDATVELYVNDAYYQKLRFEQIKAPSPYPWDDNTRIFGYKSDYVPKEGDNIKIMAESPQYGNAVAEVTVPTSVEIFDVEKSIYDFSCEELSDGSRIYSFGMSLLIWFKDRESTTDYYMFNYGSSHTCQEYIDIPGSDSYIYCVSEIIYTTPDYDREPLFTEHVSPLESAVSETSGYSIFSDRQISGKEYPLHINFSNIDFRYSNPFDDPLFKEATLNLTLNVLSKSYYQHVLSVWAHNDGINGVLGDLGLADPVWDNSNVSTGAGVVAAKSGYTYRLNLYNITSGYPTD